MAEEKKSGFRLHALNPMVLLGIIMFLAFPGLLYCPGPGEYTPGTETPSSTRKWWIRPPSITSSSSR